MKVKATPRGGRRRILGYTPLSGTAEAHSGGIMTAIAGQVHHEHTRWDPKDGELCLARAKPGEILVEARLDSDVQIDPRSWV